MTETATPAVEAERDRGPARSASGPEVAVMDAVGIFSRFAWGHTFEGTWLSVCEPRLGRYGHRLAAERPPIVLVSFYPDASFGALDDGWRIVRDGSLVRLLEPA